MIAVTSHFIGKTEVDIHPTFEIGGLNEQGRYEKDKSTLYTENKFACEGLKATLDFDAQINYQIFYYDILDNYLSSTDVLKEGYSGDAPLNGAYARIKIIPTTDEDNKISFIEKLKYSKQLNLKVAKGAEGNVDKKFTSLNGFCVQVVNNVTDSVFEYGYYWNSVTLDLIGGALDSACTAKTLLAVDGGYDVHVDYEKLALTEDQNFTIVVTQFKELPKSDSKNVSKMITRKDGENVVSLDKDTKYVLFTVWMSESEFLSANCGSFQNIISIEKPKS